MRLPTIHFHVFGLLLILPTLSMLQIEIIFFLSEELHPLVFFFRTSIHTPDTVQLFCFFPGDVLISPLNLNGVFTMSKILCGEALSLSAEKHLLISYPLPLSLWKRWLPVVHCSLKMLSVFIGCSMIYSLLLHTPMPSFSSVLCDVKPSTEF